MNELFEKNLAKVEMMIPRIDVRVTRKEMEGWTFNPALFSEELKRAGITPDAVREKGNVYMLVNMDHPIWTVQSRPIGEIDNQILLQQVLNLLATMKWHGLIGIAGPQVGILDRIVVVGLDPAQMRQKKWQGNEYFLPYTVMLNPEVIETSTTMFENKGENCATVTASYGGQRMVGAPLRPEKVKVRYQIWPGGVTVEKEFKGILAALAQHEIDHLVGVGKGRFFTSRLPPGQKLVPFDRFKGMNPELYR